VEIFHPGPGVVAAVRGAALVKSHPATREFRLKIQPGDVISEREGAGQDVGYLLHLSGSPGERLALMAYFRENLCIEMTGHEGLG
jgi:hypothetical protein